MTLTRLKMAFAILALTFAFPFLSQAQNKEAMARKSAILAKLETKLPETKLVKATLEEAIEFLRIRSIELDSTKAQAGINFVIRDRPKETIIDELTMQNSTFLEVLNAICLKTKSSYSVDEFAITIVPHLTDEEEKEAAAAPIQRRWTTPENFLGYLTPPAAKNRKIPVTDLLKVLGVTFPKDTAASYLPSSKTLIVRNTEANLHLINNIVAASHDPEKAAKEHQAVEKIILPAIILNNATLEEVVEFLRLRSRQLDPAKEGVNINLFGDEKFPDTIAPDLNLKNVPLAIALKYVCDLTHTRLIQQGRDFSIFPKGE